MCLIDFTAALVHTLHVQLDIKHHSDRTYILLLSQLVTEEVILCLLFFNDRDQHLGHLWVSVSVPYLEIWIIQSSTWSDDGFWPEGLQLTMTSVAYQRSQMKTVQLSPQSEGSWPDPHWLQQSAGHLFIHNLLILNVLRVRNTPNFTVDFLWGL